MTEKNNPYNFKEDSLRLKVYREHFVNKNTNVNSIARNINCSTSQVRNAIFNLKKIVLVNSQDIQTDTLIVENSTNQTPVILIKIFEKDNDIILSVKSSEDFEKWLKENKEIRETRNLWGKSEEGKFYYLKIVDNYYDDINKSIIYGGKINFAVLRIPGISQGVEFKIDGLLTQSQLEKAVRGLLNAFNQFYKKNIIKQKINIEAEVLVENESN